jgi:hypothetical protein
MKAPAVDTQDEDSYNTDYYIQRVLELRKALKGDSDGSARENLWKELVVALETVLEQGPTSDYCQHLGNETQLLEEISRAYYKLLQLNLDCEDHWLDWAIASKRAGNIQDCVLAHKKRMELCKQYKTTDAVRLLGFSSDYSSVDELPPCVGLFELCKDTNEATHRPSVSARKISARVRMIFEENDFSLTKCNAIISPLISESCKFGRIFSANSFFHHRHDLDIATQLCGTEVLSRLFLFGLAIPRQLAEDTIGKDSVKCLFQAGLLRTSPACETDIVGEVQIYPGPIEFFPQETSTTKCWFMTDWPMESLRPTQDAIMPVGYDTLELMSLSAGLKPAEGSRLLDLCCGCGIQGIFAVLCNPATFSILVCSDVNERACRFAAANMALNIKHDKVFCYAVKGDLFENVNEKFDCILSNPPFVATPSVGVSLHMAPASYAIGGGVDGTDILHRIVKGSDQYLEGDDARLILVTELPNIEWSCSLIQSFLPIEVPASIRIAYVGRDVETIQQYSAVRQAEASSNSDSSRDWGTAQLKSGIRNRALALLTLSSYGTGNERHLHEYGSSSEVDLASENNISSLDEEDAFLTREGIEFTRSRLLYPSYPD